VSSFSNDPFAELVLCEFTLSLFWAGSCAGHPGTIPVPSPTGLKVIG